MATHLSIGKAHKYMTDTRSTASFPAQHGTIKDKPIWILMKQETTGWQWHQLDHMQITCTSLQTDNHASTSSLNYFTCWMLFLTPNQQCWSTEGKADIYMQMNKNGAPIMSQNGTSSGYWYIQHTGKLLNRNLTTMKPTLHCICGLLKPT